MRFDFFIRKDADGYYAECPDLVSCSARGQTRQEVKDNVFKEFAANPHSPVSVHGGIEEVICMGNVITVRC